ncbi:MAG: c-type cytochrome domain-containing protein [Bdellovibrionota bacterium]|jgi:mono/diheme cytochrome c family protein|nr:c-type cytochrome domain-containing protein [Bdellovibrionota bacterium]
MGIRIILLLSLSSCLPVGNGPLFFNEKGLIGLQIPNQEFSLENEDATYENVVKYIFKDKCLGCHKADRDRGGVDLSSYDKVFGYSDYFQPIVTKGDPDQSGVYTETARGSMPPRTPLTDEEVAFLERWIREGAKEK